MKALVKQRKEPGLWMDDVPEPTIGINDVLIRVQDFADDEVLADLDIENPFELTGLYSGIDLTQRSIMDPAPSQPMVFLYRRPILDEWIERGDVELAELVAHVLVHEVGHHFGLSDDHMDRLLED